MTPSEFLHKVAEQLRTKGCSVDQSENKLATNHVEIVFAPQRATGVEGGTIEVSYTEAEEFELPDQVQWHTSLLQTTVEEVVAVVLEL